MSWKLYLNLCSPEWLNSKCSLVINLMPITSLILWTVLVLGPIKFSSDVRITFQLTELRIPGFNLFYSPITLGKNEFLKYSVLQEKELNVFGCLWDCLTTLQNGIRCLIYILCWRYSNPNSWYNFSRDLPFIDPLITKAGLYWTVSSLLKNHRLKFNLKLHYRSPNVVL